MKRRDFLQTTSTALSMAALNITVTSHASTQSKPNIILCMADDQGWGDMAYNGHPLLKTPNFDDLARSGMRFDRFYAAAPVCSPTRGSVLTGRHPNRFECFTWGDTLRPQEITLAESLKTAGYVTGHFGKWHVGSVENGSPTNPAASGFDEWLSAPNFYENDPILSRQGNAEPQQGESSMVTAEAAIEFIRKHANGSQPIFAVVWFGNPHLPHEAIDEFKQLYPDQDENLQHFYGEISAMDHAMGVLRKELKDLNIHENTMFWYCSDNGGLPNVGATGGRGKKGDIYEGGLRVPAILEWPAQIQSPQQTGMPCNTSDFYPTLLEAAGVTLKHQPQLDGVSLMPLIKDNQQKRPKPMGFWKYPAPGHRTPSHEFMQELLEAQQSGKQYSRIERLRLDAANITQVYSTDTFPGHSAWLDWPWKLHRIENDSSTRFELYNLQYDPMEENNVAEQNQSRVKSMQTEINQWLESVTHSMNGQDYQS